MSDTERMATLLRDALHAYYQSVDPRSRRLFAALAAPSVGVLRVVVTR